MPPRKRTPANKPPNNSISSVASTATTEEVSTPSVNPVETPVAPTPATEEVSTPPVNPIETPITASVPDVQEQPQETTPIAKTPKIASISSW